jgi:hypothetical protein
MWETSHPLSFAVAGYAIAASIMPNLVLIAAGHLVGSIPAASAAGLGSAALFERYLSARRRAYR